ncbi:MAG: DUF2279 domain-containing protein [Bacteroidales bacterium]|nr:DUF2279 domain-containing protein [Bacteroidales bacterium]
MKKALLAILLIFSVLSASSQDTLRDPAKVKRNVKIVVGTELALYAVSMTGLYFAWYADYPQSNFHFYNDNGEWMQMDKIGHGVTSYLVGSFGYEMLRDAGLDEKRSIWLGGTLGLAFLTTVEVFDGFSSEWGFSWGDMAANTLGAGLFIGQQFLWHEQRITLKYSFHTTEFADYRPDVLGSNFLQQTIKDYNGQTYWASFNFKSLFLNKESKFPAWLNFAFGYGATGMTGGYENALEHNGKPIPYYDRKRQFYFSLDVDFTKIPTNNKVLKYTFKVLNIFKLPFPTLEYNTGNQWVWHWIYF